MQKLTHTLSMIKPLNEEAMLAARARQDSLTKPPGSLGRLEELSIKLVGIRGETIPKLERKAIITMAADHGVIAEGVSLFPQEVTAQMVLNFLAQGAAVNVLARQHDVEVTVVDMGVKSDFDDPRVLNEKIAHGTANMVEGPAMTRSQAVDGVLAGARVALKLIDNGITIIATGEMGIGNTTASSAIVSVLGDRPVGEVVGPGTGIDEAAVAAKAALIERAISVNSPDAADPIDVLAKVGGAEIAGLTGVILGSASAGCPVVIDGFISGAAALVAARLAPKSVNHMIASHSSVEPGHRSVMAEIGLTPMLRMDMRLGEGTGAILAISIVESAVKIINEMATFSEAGVAAGDQEPQEVPTAAGAGTSAS